MTSQQANDIADVFQRALQDRENVELTTKALFFSYDVFGMHLDRLRDSFPRNVQVTHCMAVKTCPLRGLMPVLISHNFGAEAASLEEVQLALTSGISARDIVWDSPCKSVEEINVGLRMGVNLNADNFEELRRYDECFKQMSEDDRPRNQFVGLRVNPCVGAGSISAMSTATENSKFGVAVSMYKDEIISNYKKYKWLNMMHVHSGSQGCTLAHIAKGIAVVFELCEEINELLGRQQITAIDIGGGIPVDYSSDDIDAHLNVFDNYVNEIKKAAGGLFSGKFHLFTEMGRSLTAKCGWIASRVEYIKRVSDRYIITQHVGADMLLRTCYQPETWSMRMFFCDPAGVPKGGSKVKCDVVGPLCFSGDVLASGREFPVVQPGDWLIVCDAGSNTIGLFSRHCSRACLPVFAYWMTTEGTSSDCVHFKCIKRPETIEDVINFWQ